MSNISNECILSLKNIYKDFGSINALCNVSLDVNKGDILALVGDNGSGKSTLIKIISGEISPTQGEIYINNKCYKKLSMSDAIKIGITTIYQDLALVDTLKVWENIFLGREIMKFKFLRDSKAMILKSNDLLKSLNVNIKSINSTVESLSGGQRQCIAVARAIHQGGKVLLMDEPTAAMGVNESRKVFDLIKNLKTKGYTIIIVCHNINTVFDISDKIAVMKNGSLISLLSTKNTSANELINIISD